jgi:hypothetical protein
MATTTITGTINGVNNTALANKWITFRLVQLGTDSVATATVAQSVDSVQTDANGDFSIGVWNNGDSGKPSVLEITIDGSKAESVIIPTATATIELWDLIENYQADGSTSEQVPTVSDLFLRKASNLAELTPTASTARANIGVTIGTDVQAHSAVLDATTASFTTAEESKLSGIEALAEVNDATTVLDADIGSTVQAYSAILDATTASFTTAKDTAISTNTANIATNVTNIATNADGIAQSTVVVKQASDLSGTLLSTVVYFIDGIIDMGSQSIDVPTGGLSLVGSTFDVSQLTSSAASYTMFTSPVGGSGNLLGKDLAFEASGTGSQVFNLVSATGFDAFEFARINFNNCTSLGTVDNYRQGLEEGSGRFGGTPTMTLKGTWVGGYRITTSIVRSLSAGMTTPLFSAGVGFSMASRFLTDINCDLPALAPLMDFAPANFTNPGTLQLKGAIISRNGAFDSTDTNILPNISRADLASNFDDNIGVDNTFVGGRAFVSSESVTTVSSIGAYYTLNANWGSNNLQHFDSPSGGQLRHLGNNPREFKVNVNFNIESTATNEIGIRLRKWDDSAGSFSEFAERAREINSFVGGRDVGFYNFSFNVTLDQNDYVFFQVRNNTSTDDLTLELSSDFSIEER